MIKVKIGKKEYDIPDELSVEQYQRLQVHKYLLENADPAKLLAVYLDIPPNDIKNANKEQVKFIEGFVFERLTKNISKDMIFTFDFQGVTYGYENDWKKLAWGAWQDLEFLSSENVTDNIHKIMAVLYRPVVSIKGTKYVIEEYDANTIEERAELFKKVPVKIWFGAAQLFFFTSQKYISNIKSSLEWKMKIHKWMTMGINLFPTWLRKRLRLDSISQRHLNSVRTI